MSARDEWLEDVGRSTGFALEDLRIAKAVCDEFEPSRRHENLPFDFHAAVLGLPRSDQDELLDEAEKWRWSLKTLEAKVRIRKMILGHAART